MAVQHATKIERESHEVCGICKDEMSEAPMVNMACAHKFHQECLDAYKEARGLTSAQVPCPLCKLTQSNASSLEAELLVEPPSAAAMPGPLIGAMDGEAAPSTPTLRGPSAAKVASSNRVVPVMEKLRDLPGPLDQRVL